jgi:Uncharacterised nucleotidyltransferase
MATANYALERAVSSGELWAGVDRLIDRSPSLAALRRHRLHLLAGRRWRQLGRPIPDDLANDERLTTMSLLATPMLLEQVRAGYDGPLVLFKGPEVAERYPDPALRDFLDLDFLVPNAAAAQQSLISAGFEEFGDAELFADIHHLRPLFLPGFHLRIEVHNAPKWVDQLAPPPTDELFSSPVPSAVGVEGILALAPAQHALVLALHSWAHEPLKHVGQLLDVAAVADEADRAEIARLARRWGVSKIWKTTERAIDALFRDAPGRSTALATWARHLRSARERSVLESHVESWISGFWGLPMRKALRQLATEITWEVRPTPGESMRSKLSRSRRALRNAFIPRSEHDRGLGPEAQRRRDRRSL